MQPITGAGPVVRIPRSHHLLGERKRPVVANNKNSCRCCQKETPKIGARICPECSHTFRGNGWDGIDAHWRGKTTGHEDVMDYEDFWAGLCPEHRAGR
jgi:hypothetical protein